MRNGNSPRGGKLVLTGTVTAGVEHDCRMLQGYQLIGGPRELYPPGTRVRVTGTPDPGMVTIGQQGTPLLVSAVEPLP